LGLQALLLPRLVQREVAKKLALAEDVEERAGSAEPTASADGKASSSASPTSPEVRR
jgi:hypothetical protein